MENHRKHKKIMANPKKIIEKHKEITEHPKKNIENPRKIIEIHRNSEYPMGFYRFFKTVLLFHTWFCVFSETDSFHKVFLSGVDAIKSAAAKALAMYPALFAI